MQFYNTPEQYETREDRDSSHWTNVALRPTDAFVNFAHDTMTISLADARAGFATRLDIPGLSHETVSGNLNLDVVLCFTQVEDAEALARQIYGVAQEMRSRGQHSDEITYRAGMGMGDPDNPFDPLGEEMAPRTVNPLATPSLPSPPSGRPGGPTLDKDMDDA